MKYGLSVKWHNSCFRQNVLVAVFFARPQNPYVKKAGFFLRLHADKKIPFCMSKNLKQTYDENQKRKEVTYEKTKKAFHLSAVTDPDIHHDAVVGDTRERSRELNRTIYYR